MNGRNVSVAVFGTAMNVQMMKQCRILFAVNATTLYFVRIKWVDAVSLVNVATRPDVQHAMMLIQMLLLVNDAMYAKVVTAI
mmetsp:Transcript_26365/g.32303  ORF Transcript_26365/g.32303 Transcript_26365/m.32303 type:complete len:82 (+) Transcript_26365:613-858(+)